MAPDASAAPVVVLHGGAHELARHLGPDGFHVLRELVVSSRGSRADVVVTEGCRELGRRLGLSKDTVNRRINDLLRLGVLECLGAARPAERFARRSYRLRLDLAGIEVVPSLRVPSAGGSPPVVEGTNGSDTDPEAAGRGVNARDDAKVSASLGSRSRASRRRQRVAVSPSQLSLPL